MAVTVWELFGVWGCLVVVFATLLCLCNERYSHWATGSVRKELDILPHSFLLSSKLKICTTLVVHVEGWTCLQAECFTYIHETVTAWSLQVFECGVTWRGEKEVAIISWHAHSESGPQKNPSCSYYTVLFAQVSPAARRSVMATADISGPDWQIESNNSAARRITIE